MNQSALVISYITKLLESSKNSGMKGSDVLLSILARKKILEKVVKVTIKENEQEIPGY